MQPQILQKKRKRQSIYSLLIPFYGVKGYKCYPFSNKVPLARVRRNNVLKLVAREKLMLRPGLGSNEINPPPASQIYTKH